MRQLPAEVIASTCTPILLHLKVSTSFRNIRTIHGQEHSTCRGAAEALGMLESDAEYYHALDDAACCKSPRQMRLLFTQIVLRCDSKSPVELWNAFRDNFCDGF